MIDFVIQHRQNKYLVGFRPFLSYGWGNGYVAIPPNHPLYHKSDRFLKELVDVSGGLTFDGLAGILINGKPDNVPNDYRVIGFDTMHYDSDAYTHDELFVRIETKRLRKQLEDYKE